MPDIPGTSSARMAASETNSRRTGQRNNRVVWENLSEEEKLAAIESLTVYCRPIELYNIIKSRTKKKPLYLRRCMDYHIKAKRKKRLVLTASLSWKDDDNRALFPLCVCLGRLDPNTEARSAQRYHVGKISSFKGLSGVDGKGNTQLEVNFMLPEFDKLAGEVSTAKYWFLVFASAGNPISLSRANSSPWPVEVSSNEFELNEYGGDHALSAEFALSMHSAWGGERCLYGKVSLNFHQDNGNVFPYFLLRKPGKIKIEMNLHPCILTYHLQYCIQRKSKIISIQDSRNSKAKLEQFEVSFCLEEFGAREKSSSQTNTSTEVSWIPPSSSQILWSKEGNVVFCYRYYNNKLHRTEEFGGFSICLFECEDRNQYYKGCMVASFLWFYSLVENKCLEKWKHNKDVGAGINPRLQTFLYCAKRLKHREPTRGRTNETDRLLFNAGVPSPDESKAIILHPGPRCVPSIFDHDNGTHAMLQYDPEGVSDEILLPGPDCVLSVSDHDDVTHAMILDDHEGVSNATLHHEGVSNRDDGTRAMLLDDHEGSNATLHPGPDCVPSDDDGTHAMLEDDSEGVTNAILLPRPDYVPSLSDHHGGTRAVPQVDHEGVSNVIVLNPSQDCVASTSKHDHGAPKVRKARKKDKLPIEQYDPRIVARFEKRQFYHSHKYQPMALEEALLDEDSEDEMNEGAQEIEDRRRLAILDAPDHVKEFLSLWNAFIKKHRGRVLADGHINWACEAFTKYHSAEFAQSNSLAWNWRMFMIKLINQGLLKTSTFVACNNILEQCRKQNQDPQRQNQDPQS
ncbi:Polycomb group protein EMF2B [Glycine max]|nr:Polycomb group protein EMF2B [Glycine max]